MNMRQQDFAKIFEAHFEFSFKRKRREQLLAYTKKCGHSSNLLFETTTLSSNPDHIHRFSEACTELCLPAVQRIVFALPEEPSIEVFPVNSPFPYQLGFYWDKDKDGGSDCVIFRAYADFE